MVKTSSDPCGRECHGKLQGQDDLEPELDKLAFSRKRGTKRAFQADDHQWPGCRDEPGGSWARKKQDVDRDSVHPNQIWKELTRNLSFIPIYNGLSETRTFVLYSPLGSSEYTDKQNFSQKLHVPLEFPSWHLLHLSFPAATASWTGAGCRKDEYHLIYIRVKILTQAK